MRSVVHIVGIGTSFYYNMRTRDFSWSAQMMPIHVLGRFDVVEIAPPPNDEFHIKVKMVLLLRNLEVV